MMGALPFNVRFITPVMVILPAATEWLLMNSMNLDVMFFCEVLLTVMIPFTVIGVIRIFIREIVVAVKLVSILFFLGRLFL